MAKTTYNTLRGDNMQSEYKVQFFWDSEASVWVATSEDVHGLVLEYEPFDVLLERVRLAIPELLAFDEPVTNDIFLDFTILRKDRLVAHG